MAATLQRLQGAFPNVNTGLLPDFTLSDFVANGGGRSQGHMSILPVSAQATIARPWTVLGWSITFHLLLGQVSGAVNGFLGRLYGGLIMGGPVTPQFDVPFTGLPSDPSTIAELWNGATDDTPPWIATANTTPSTDTYVMQLPVPLLMAPSDQLSMGLWLTPQLGAPVADGGNRSIFVSGEWSILYSTGS
jgi:hypothetical protein